MAIKVRGRTSGRRAADALLAWLGTLVFLGNALVLGGCSDESAPAEAIFTLDITACFGNPTQAAGSLCSPAARSAFSKETVACLVFEPASGKGGVQPMTFDPESARLVPTPPVRGFALDSDTQAMVRLFILQPGATAASCAGLGIKTSCAAVGQGDGGGASCLLSLGPASVSPGKGGRLKVEFGRKDGPGCQIECNDPCEPATGECVRICGDARHPWKELCNGVDDDCDGEQDEDFAGLEEACTVGLGACQRAGRVTCTPDGLATACDAVPGEPTAELCDGVDNDCDGQTDEEFAWTDERGIVRPVGGACDGLGECGQGTVLCRDAATACCSSNPDCGGSPVAEETCNGKDDDCDGQTDEGYTWVEEGGALPTALGEVCPARGACGPGRVVCLSDGSGACCSTWPGCRVAQQEETECDGLDNDCDGQTDEDVIPPGDLTCLQQGVCAGSRPVCQGVAGWACLYPPQYEPLAEVSCDGLDNDCDGSTDDEFQVGESCDGAGICTGGRLECAADTRSARCSVAPGGSEDMSRPEVCDGLDNDCDGPVDEDVVPGEGDGCLVGGVCGETQPECLGGRWRCFYESEDYETVETSCDGLDNDCDGQTDEDLVAPPASFRRGVCTGSVMVCQGLAGWAEPDYAAIPGYEDPEVTCDGLDNDCDGRVDPHCSCLPGSEQPCGPYLGECVQGTQLCTEQGTWGECTGGVGPQDELCDGLDNDCDGVIDDGNPEGGSVCGSSVGECRPGVEACRGGELVCEGGVWPGVEICDNRDNDCNGTADDLPPGDPCGTDVGECSPGVRVCQAGQWSCQGAVGPQDELCDGLDNDCDGEIDDGNPGGGALCGERLGECRQGTRTCVEGELVCLDAIGPSAEVCDNRDNDCNGFVDDGIEARGLCGSDVGECQAGSEVCDRGQWVCHGESGPTQEICDGLDNDCDTEVDEELNAPPALLNTGVCAGSTQVCRDGAWEEPDYTALEGYDPTTDGCDELDNDCDGRVDEDCGCAPGSTSPCGPAAQGECRPGVQTCLEGGVWGNCVGAILPDSEQCDGKDNDCDGQIDEDFQLGQVCAAIANSPCGPGSWECDAQAVGRICSTHPGGSEYLPLDEQCDGVDNDCDRSVDEDFPLGEVCPGIPGTPCGDGLWECDRVEAQPICSTHPGGSQYLASPELCNGQDDDCDGQLDEGFDLGQACAGLGECPAGVWQCNLATSNRVCSTLPGGSNHVHVPESCDELDNDCDGQTDEDFMVGDPCSGTGICGSGVLECAGLTGVRCSTLPGGSAYPGTEEECNDLDDDCDGITDEDEVNQPLTRACYSGDPLTRGVGECHDGLSTCVDGEWELACTGDRLPAAEVCNDLDDDCDGQTDDGVQRACYTGPPGTEGVGICHGGTETCAAGAWGSCQGEVTPLGEVAGNGLDDNCDGTVDESPCLGSELHWNGHCYRSGNSKTCTEAEAQCVSWGGHLVTVGDAAENAWLRETFHGTGGGGYHAFYIGLQRTHPALPWSWSDGTSFSAASYQPWTPGEPSALPKEHCVQILDNAAGTWDACVHDQNRRYVCERVPGT